MGFAASFRLTAFSRREAVLPVPAQPRRCEVIGEVSTDLFEDGLSPWERCVELRDENPDRTVFWGTVNPLEGRKALEQMEVQINEYGAA